MNWDDYDVYCHVIEQGGFSAAARATDRPRSSISAAVMRLEEELKTRLLERSTRRVSMTEAGELLYQSIGPLFIRLREARTEVAARDEVVRGTLRIAAPYEFGAHHLGAVACTMMSHHPALNVQIDVEDTLLNPLDRRYDIVFSMVDIELLSPSTIAKRVFSLRPGIFASPALLADRGHPTQLEDLAELPLLASTHDTAWSFVGPDGQHDTLTITAPRLRSANATVRRQAAIAGLGVLRVTATFCEDAVRDGQLCRLLDQYACTPMQVHALLPGRRHSPAKVRVFLDELSAQLPA